MRSSLVLILASLLAVTGCDKVKGLFAKTAPGEGKGKEAKQAEAEKPGNEATIAAATGSVNDELVFDGTVKAAERVEIRADRRIKVAKRLVEVRAVVKKGQKLIDADKTEIQTKMKELTDREARSKLEMSSLDVQLDHRRKVVARKKILQEKNIIPLREFEEATRDMKVEENNQAAKRLDFERLTAELAQLYAAAQFSDVVSPIDGLVSEIASGNEVREGDVVAVIINTTRFSLKVPVDEQSRMRIKVGGKAEVTLEADNTRKFTGQIANIAVSPDAGTEGGAKTFQTQIDFDNQDMKLAEGYRGKARFVLGTAENAVLLPKSALRKAGGKTYVLVAGLLGSSPEPRDVETGVEGLVDVEIKSGVKAGEQVLVGY